MSKGASETRAANPTDPQKLCNKLNHSLAMCPNVHNILEFSFKLILITIKLIYKPMWYTYMKRKDTKQTLK